MGAPVYLIASDDNVFAIGNDIREFASDVLDRPLCAFRRRRRAGRSDDGRAVRRAPADSDTLTLVGRVQAVTDALVVPTMSGLLLVDQETGRICTG